MRRAWLLRSFDPSSFQDGYPTVTGGGESVAQLAFDSDPTTIMTVSGTPSTIYLGIHANNAEIYGFFIEPVDWDSLLVNNIYFEYGDGGYTYDVEYEDVFGGGFNLTDTIYVETDNTPVFATFRNSVLADYMRLTFTGTGDLDFSVPEIWVGNYVELSPMFSTGWSVIEERVGFEGSSSLVGVDLDRASKAASISFKKSWTFTMEWIVGTQKDEIMNFYCIRPLKYITLSEFGVFEHHTVVFGSAPKVQEVENDYYTVTFNLREV